MEIITNVPAHLLELPEEFEPPQKVEKTNNNVPDVDSLTPPQRTVYDILIKYLSGTLSLEDIREAAPDRDFQDLEEVKMIVLKGYAGTGKTYLFTQVLKYFVWMIQGNIAVTAPTNKAVKVLKNTADFTHPLIQYATIHKLYGLKEKIDEETGKTTFEPEYGEENQIDGTMALGVDETSMLQDFIFHLIKESNNRNVSHSDNSRTTLSNNNIDDFLSKVTGAKSMTKDNLKVIFLGDPIQIPPIGKSGCIPFNKANEDIYGLLTLELTEIIRQKEGNPILELATITRENVTMSTLPYDRETKITEQGGIIFINKKDKDTVYKICELYFTNARFKHDSDFMKVIAWTNRCVDIMNDRIRGFIHKEKMEELVAEAIEKEKGNTLFDLTTDELDRIKAKVKLPRILIGEKLVANTPITEESDFRTITLFNTNDEFEVTDFTVKEVEVMTGFDIMVYKTRVKYYNQTTGKMDFKVIQVVHDDSIAIYNQACEHTKKAALKAPKEERGKKWKFHYMIKRKFADVKYNYAITAHKSQGSTYQNAIVIVADIDMNKNVVERNKIKYVAFTRPKQHLFIVE